MTRIYRVTEVVESFERHTFTDDSVIRAAEHRIMSATSARHDIAATTDTRTS